MVAVASLRSFNPTGWCGRKHAYPGTYRSGLEMADKRLGWSYVLSWYSWELILNVPLSRFDVQDSVDWLLSKNGLFSVKMAYYIAR